MQRTMPERNLNLADLPADVHQYLMQFLSLQDLTRLKATNRHFNKQVKNYLSAKTTPHQIKKTYRHHLFAVRTDNLNNYIENELDQLPNSPLKTIMILFVSSAASISLGLMTRDLPIASDILLAVGAILLASAVILGIRYAIIDRRIDHAYRQIDQLNDMEAGRLPRLR